MLPEKRCNNLGWGGISGEFCEYTYIHLHMYLKWLASNRVQIKLVTETLFMCLFFKIQNRKLKKHDNPSNNNNFFKFIYLFVGWPITGVWKNIKDSLPSPFSSSRNLTPYPLYTPPPHPYLMNHFFLHTFLKERKNRLYF